mmetsp:Transcript_61377/g.176666  ORF Transcript_61377/g.176666 Transcript_61377/m.176666 type:complete len:102 (-) Transcript_61377:729-1034(-)
MPPFEDHTRHQCWIYEEARRRLPMTTRTRTKMPNMKRRISPVILNSRLCNLIVCNNKFCYNFDLHSSVKLWLNEEFRCQRLSMYPHPKDRIRLNQLIGIVP